MIARRFLTFVSIFIFVGLAASTAQASAPKVNVPYAAEIPAAVFEKFGVEPGDVEALHQRLNVNGGCTIVNPNPFVSDNPSDIAWITPCSTPTQGVLEFRLLAFTYDFGIPDSGGITCRYLGTDWAEDQLLRSGFEEEEDPLTLVDNGVMEPDWWFALPSPPNSYQTDKQFVTVTEVGWYSCAVYWINNLTPPVVLESAGQYLFEVEQIP